MGTPAALLCLALLAAAPDGGDEARPAAVYATVERHGRVVLDVFSTRAQVPAVTFEHWRHRI